MARTAALVATAALIAFLAFFTVREVVRDGFGDFLVIASLILIAILGFGVAGALAYDPDE